MSVRPVLAVLVLATTAGAGLVACRESKSERKSEHPASSSSAVPPKVAEAHDAAAPAPTTAKAEPPPYDGPYLGALFNQTPVMSDMDWPKRDEEGRIREDKKGGAVRIGYIRQGQKVPVLPEPHVKHNCKEGWYELVQGGFVCGRYASLDLNHPRIKTAPHAPDMAGPLPYQYGYNVANGTPLYRTAPSREERLKLEPWLAPKTVARKAKTRVVDEEESASADDALDAGTMPITLAKATTMTASTTDPFGLDETLDAGTPWYLRTYDGGKPAVTLDELKGEGPIARRMVKGFFVALDKDMSANGRWWRTTAGLLAPYERIFVHNAASKFHGVWLDETSNEAKAHDAVITVAHDGGAPTPLPAGRKPTPDLCKPGSKSQVAIVTFYKAHKYVLGASRKAVSTGDALARHSVARLTGETVAINGATYAETDEGWYLRTSDAVVTNPAAPPKDLATNEKWIDVSLRSQTLVAFEGDRPVFATAVSTGRENHEDAEKDHHTPPGQFRIREKHIASTMDGDVASDGPYSIEDVPWIMYFNGSYALHGAFWHNNFGRQQSHGCVNLAPIDAKAIFGWTEPHLPDGWHGVMATNEKPGTRVVVHD